MFRHAANEVLIVPERSIQIGIRTHNPDTMGFHILDAPSVHAGGTQPVIDAVRDDDGRSQGLRYLRHRLPRPRLRAGTGTPVSGGLSSAQAIAILSGLAGIDIVGADVVEVAPAYDSAQMTALAAAHIGFLILGSVRGGPGPQAAGLTPARPAPPLEVARGTPMSPPCSRTGECDDRIRRARASRLVPDRPSRGRAAHHSRAQRRPVPGVVTPVTVARPGSVAAAQEALKSGRKIGVLLQRDPGVEAPTPEDLHRIGTIATILRDVATPDGSHHLMVRGEQRFRALDFIPGNPFLLARAQYLPEIDSHNSAIEARALYLKQQALAAIELLPQAPAELANAVQQIDSPSTLADLIASFIDIPAAEKQELLATIDLHARLDKVVDLVAHRMEVLRISREIDQKTKQSLDERQRRAMLHEQLRTIRKQLGEDEEERAEIEEIDQAITEAKMPEEVETQARKELKRLERMPEAAGEYSMLRTYLDWLIALPWSKLDEESIDIAKAREILDEDHYGLDKVKKRILEYLAVRKLNREGRSPILCFVGPPGVGKTSLGQSIARALGLEFVRASLGGVHDEAEIRGHRRTYIGALPGNIIQALRKAETRNPVFMLDEVDKLGAGFHGDPSSALLEVLDPSRTRLSATTTSACPST
jgi:Lon protease-like protein